MRILPPSARDAHAIAYRALPSVAQDARRYARAIIEQTGTDIAPYRTLGALTRADVDQVRAITGFDVAGYDYSLAESEVRHIQRRHGNDASERQRGQRGITAEDYANLPAILSEPDSVEPDAESGTGRPVVKFEKVIEGERVTVVTEVRGKRRTLTVLSMRVNPNASPR
ncbi:MAG: hypothetical protein H6981_11640 [Gammaproteobacteria bacterium]|nr:hypothetical protein [Gammaproteobacteria bacterium]MCP5137440.1 hypothetical protein [Gammaproteobacteria bacterium]